MGTQQISAGENMELYVIANHDHAEVEGVQAFGLTPSFDEAEYGQFGTKGSILTTRTYKSSTGSIDINNYNEENYGRLALDLTTGSAIGLNQAFGVEHDIYINVKDDSDQSKYIKSIYVRGVKGTNSYGASLTGVETKRVDIKCPGYVEFPAHAVNGDEFTATNSQVVFVLSETPVQYFKRGGLVDSLICKCAALSGKIIRLDIDGVEQTTGAEMVGSAKGLNIAAGVATGLKVRAFYIFDGTA